MNSIRNELKAFFTDHWKYMAVQTACKLNIFDLIKNGINCNEKIIKEIKGNKRALETLLQVLLQLGFLEINDGNYNLNNKSNLLIDENPLTLKNACILWGEEHLEAWKDLEYTIKTGLPSFEKSNIAYFDYLAETPEKLINYHKAMHEYAIEDYKDIHRFINFNKYNSVIDIGGSLGALISEVRKYSTVKNCYLFDKEEVVSLRKIENVSSVSGDFFDDIPNVSDCLVLSRILHDWENKKANIILQNCYSALPNKGEIIIIENFTNRIKNKASLLSLNMMIMCRSFERSQEEYSSLLRKNGFSIREIKKLNNLQYIIIASKL